MKLLRKGFTLAEVLITLGIIGIVAAMTLPTIVHKYKEIQRITQLKKAYSTLSQAFNMVKLEYGDPRYWGFTNSVIGKDEEGNNIIDSSSQNLIKTLFSQYIKQAKGKHKHSFRKYISLDGRNYETDGNAELKSENILYLADGTMVSFGWVYEDCNNQVVSCGDIQVFLPEKNAQLGVSTFYFYLTPEGIKPWGDREQTVRPFKEYCDRKNSKGIVANSQGRSCTAWVLYNDNMDYLHCDDLSWDGKTKCN